MCSQIHEQNEALYKNQVYASAEDFDFVLDHIKERIPAQDTDVIRKFSKAPHGRGAYERKLPKASGK